MMKIWSLNESVAIGRSRDKLRSLQILARKGLGLPDEQVDRIAGLERERRIGGG